MNNNNPLPLPQVREISIAELIKYCIAHYPLFATMLLSLSVEPANVIEL